MWYFTEAVETLLCDRYFRCRIVAVEEKGRPSAWYGYQRKEPDCVLAAHTQARIIPLLETMQQMRGISMVLISHEPFLVGRFSGTVWPLEAGRLSAA